MAGGFFNWVSGVGYRVSGVGCRGQGPGGACRHNLLIHRTVRLVRAGEVAGAHEELAYDLAAHEAERLPEQLDPIVLRTWMMRIQPRGEGAVALTQLEDHACVVDHRVDLHPIADDPRIREQPRP